MYAFVRRLAGEVGSRWGILAWIESTIDVKNGFEVGREVMTVVAGDRADTSGITMRDWT